MTIVNWNCLEENKPKPGKGQYLVRVEFLREYADDVAALIESPATGKALATLIAGELQAAFDDGFIGGTFQVLAVESAPIE